MRTNAKRTQGMWLVAGLSPQFHLIGGNPQELIADFSCGRDRASVDLANAQFAQQACNSYDELVAALEAIRVAAAMPASNQQGHAISEEEFRKRLLYIGDHARAALKLTKGAS